MGNFIDDLAAEILMHRNALIESACATAKDTGTHGVLVVEDGINYFHVQVSELVPFGHLCTFPSGAAVAEWIQNGRPL